MQCMVWHNNHGPWLVSWSDIDHRRKEIPEIKPAHEVPTRLKHLQKVKGELPEELVAAAKKLYEAWEAVQTAWEARVARAWVARAWDAYKKAYDKYLPEINALHAKECPDCCWDEDKREMVFPKDD